MAARKKICTAPLAASTGNPASRKLFISGDQRGQRNRTRLGPSCRSAAATMTSWISPARLDAAASHAAFCTSGRLKPVSNRNERQDQPAIDRERRKGGGPEAPAHVENRGADGGERHAQARWERTGACRARPAPAFRRREDPARGETRSGPPRSPRGPSARAARARRRPAHRRRSRRPRPAPGGSRPARAPD